MKETSDLTSSLLSLWSSSPNVAEIIGLEDALNVNDKMDSVLSEICQELINCMPKKFDLSVAEAKYPVDYNNSLNQVLHQELIRYNNL
jgi:dynein heavy chain